ncbi:MAG: complex I NDUFA9 subunit family protein [Caldimonas sp.]
MAKVLLLGGTGFLGRALCEKLVERFGGAGARIVVPSRRPPRAKGIQMLPTVELVRADLHDDAQLARLVKGCEAVVNLVGILHGSEAAFDRAHVQLPRRLAEACVSAGVTRVVHVSAIGADARAPSRYLRSKAAGEAAYAGKSLDLTVLRPSVLFGDGDSFLTLFARLQSIFPVLPIGGSGARFQPVWVDDVATAIVRALDDRTTIGETIECCGPEVYTLKQLVQIAGRSAGHSRPVIDLPAPLARLQAFSLELLPGEPLMSRDNLDSMQVPSIASGDRPGLARLGIQPSSVEAVAPVYLGLQQGPGRLDAWRAAVHGR